MHGFIASYGLWLIFVFIFPLVVLKKLMKCRMEWKFLFIILSISAEITAIATDFPGMSDMKDFCHITSDFGVVIYISSLCIVVPLLMYGLSKLVCSGEIGTR